MKITFVGLGRMGSGIAGNLLKAGHDLTVFNRSRDKEEALVKAGAKSAASLRESVKQCDAVFTMLADDQAVADTVFGNDGIAAGLPKGSAHISNSTISVAMARRLDNEHIQHGQAYISAPVFGRFDAAEAKKLLVVAAGDANQVEKFRPLLDSIGRHTYVAGSEPWHANLIKLNGNFMIACMIETFGESFATMRKAGVDHHLFHEIMSELFGSPLYKAYGGAVANDKFEPAGFALKLGYKDIRLGLEAAGDLQAPMPFAGILRDHFLAALANGQADLDWSSVGKIPALLAGLKETTKS